MPYRPRPGANPSHPICAAPPYLRCSAPSAPFHPVCQRQGQVASVHSAVQLLCIWAPTCAFFDQIFSVVVQMYTLGYFQCAFCRISFVHVAIYLRFFSSNNFRRGRMYTWAGHLAQTDVRDAPGTKICRNIDLCKSPGTESDEKSTSANRRSKIVRNIDLCKSPTGYRPPTSSVRPTP